MAARLLLRADALAQLRCPTCAGTLRLDATWRERDTKTTTTTDVEIFGTVYHVRGEDNPEHLQEVANLVDQRMREVAQQVTTVDTAKIAILAALNIADEMHRRGKKQDGERVDIQERVATLTEKLEKALES